MKDIFILCCCIFLLTACGQEEKKTEKQQKNLIEERQDIVQENKDLIKVRQPKPDSKISSPLKIEGKAKGNWFFEATASVELVDHGNNIIAETYIEATEDWMTDDYVPFEAALEFDSPTSEKGYLVFHKANPSGLSEYADEYKIPVRFK